MTSSESRRQSVRDYHAKRKLAGERKLTFWIKPETDRVLTELAEKYGSKDAAVNAAILKEAYPLMVYDPTDGSVGPVIKALANEDNLS